MKKIGRVKQKVLELCSNFLFTDKRTGPKSIVGKYRLNSGVLQ